MRFPQFHLSTALALMLAAGGLMWANLVPNDFYFNEAYKNNGQRSYQVLGKNWGWPLAVNDRHSVLSIDDLEVVSEKIEVHPRWLRIVANVLIGLLILIATGVCCEMISRRRDRKRKGAIS